MINVGNIISRHENQQLVVVISALGKTTNALEEVAQAFFKQDFISANEKIDALENQHIEIAKALIKDSGNQLYKDLDKLFDSLRTTLEYYKPENFDFLYDQVVSVGELLSTKILTAYLHHIGLNVIWLDARTVVKTDTNYREPKINWDETREKSRSWSIRVSFESGLQEWTVCFDKGKCDGDSVIANQRYTNCTVSFVF